MKEQRRETGWFWSVLHHLIPGSTAWGWCTSPQLLTLCPEVCLLAFRKPPTPYPSSDLPRHQASVNWRCPNLPPCQLKSSGKGGKNHGPPPAQGLSLQGCLSLPQRELKLKAQGWLRQCCRDTTEGGRHPPPLSPLTNILVFIQPSFTECLLCADPVPATRDELNGHCIRECPSQQGRQASKEVITLGVLRAYKST